MRHALLPALIALTLPAWSQEAASESFQLLDLVLDAGGGGACSADYALWSAADGTLSDPLVSSNYELSVGFVAAVDAEPGNTPVVFGVDPFFGPMEGGAALSVTGLNFDKFGVGPSVAVTIGGLPAADVVVVSDTLLTCTAPAVAQGPQDLQVTSSYGAGALPEAYVSTPAITSTKVVPPGGAIELLNYGPVGSFCTVYWSFNTTSIPIPPYGILEIGPSPIIFGLSPVVYPAPDGINTFSFTAPSAPAFVGLTLYWQTIVFVSLSPLEVIFSNLASTQLP